jgi:UDP-arabinose 4-epimerase
MKKEKAVLVAGGAGYIGAHTCKILRRNGFTPVVLDNLVTGNRWAVKFGPFVEGDIGDRSAVAALMKTYAVDSAILFAGHAYVGESIHAPGKYFRNNISQALEFLDAFIQAGGRNLVFSSSCSIYGMQNRVPIREDALKNPLSPYAETKLFLEKALGWYDRAYGLQSVILRYFNAAGADPDGELGEQHDPETHLIPLAIQSALDGPALRIFGTDYPTADGTAVRDYIHVTDLASAHVLALGHLQKGGTSEQFNCGTGHGYSVREIVSKVEGVSGRSVGVELAPRREGDAPVLVADSSKIREALGWEPVHSSLDQIVSTAWRWHAELSGTLERGFVSHAPAY